MTTTFQLGMEMFTVQYFDNHARVTKRPFVRDITKFEPYRDNKKKQQSWFSRWAIIFNPSTFGNNESTSTSSPT